MRVAVCFSFACLSFGEDGFKIRRRLGARNTAQTD